MKQDLKLAVAERVKILPYQVWDDIQDYTTKIKLIESYISEIEKMMENDDEEVDECVFCESKEDVFGYTLNDKYIRLCENCYDKIR